MKELSGVGGSWIQVDKKNLWTLLSSVGGGGFREPSLLCLKWWGLVYRTRGSCLPFPSPLEARDTELSHSALSILPVLRAGE